MGVSLLNFFDLKPLNTSKRALNINPPFFGDTLYIHLILEILETPEIHEMQEIKEIQESSLGGLSLSL